MGSCKTRDSSMNKAFVLASMALLGLEVDAHLRDSSVYSGVFYTANFDNGFSIVLKNARMTKKGNSKSNVGADALVATLVILSGDLVQVVAKGGQLRPDGDAWKEAAKKSDGVEQQPRDSVQKENELAQGPGIANEKKDQVKTVTEKKITVAPNQLPTSANVPVPSVNSTPTTPIVTDLKSVQSLAVPPTKTVKESKLNPKAKVFFPPMRKPVAANSTAPVVTCMAYVPNRVPSVAPPEVVGLSPFRSYPSMPIKVLPYGNLPAGTVGPVSQFPQPIVGHLGNRQPLRVAGPGIVHPNHQPFMVGRPGQLVYGHPPPPQEIIHQGLPFTRPIPTPQYQLHFPKQQGQAIAPQYTPPYPFATVQHPPPQPYSMPYNIPVMQQQFAPNRYVQAPGTNGIFNTRFQ